MNISAVYSEAVHHWREEGKVLWHRTVL